MNPAAKRGRLFVAAAALLWSSGGLAIKLVPLTGLGVAFWRSLVSALFLLLVFRPSRARWKSARPSTVAVYALMILTFVSATKMTTAANAIFLQYTGPLYVLALAPFLLKERFRKSDAVAVGVALAGMSLFFVGRLNPGGFEGNVLAVFSGLFFGLTILLLRRDASGDAIPSVIAGNLAAAALAFPFAGRSLALDVRGFLLVLFLGVVQLGASYVLFVKGLESVPATEASLIGMLEPMFNPLWAFLGIGERPGAWALLGGAIVLGAVAGRTIFGAIGDDRGRAPILSPD